MELKDKALALRDELVAIRRHLHQNPEPSMAEFATTAYIRGLLDKWQIPWLEAGATGTVAVLQGQKPGKIAGLRADTDALEMQELNTCSYRSLKDGLMHACGHDAHTAALLGAILLLKESTFNGQVKCIFQPGEEGGNGADSVVASGAVDDVQGILGMHVSSSISIGQATIKSGVMSSANDRFIIRLTGRGCHGSTPEQGADALLAGAALVQALQTIASRENSPLDPTALTVGVLKSGTAFNIVAEEAYLEGSCRTLKKENRQKNRLAIQRIAEHTAAAYKCRAEASFESTADIVDNDPALTALARKAAKTILGEEQVREQGLSLGAEDFAAFQKIAPITYLNIGSRNENEGTAMPHHHGLFDIDEAVLPLSAAIYAQFALDFLAE